MVHRTSSDVPTRLTAYQPCATTIIGMQQPGGAVHNRGHVNGSRWPMAGLRLRTPALELRWPSLGDLDALADLAAVGVHDPDVQPFTVPWTDVPPDERARSTMQYHWSR